jgi:beta-lactamase regulating signal transducer with metallopeptidase domain
MASMLGLIVANALIVSLLAIGLAAICRLRLFQQHPAIRHLLWLLVLLKLLVPPLIPLPVLPEWAGNSNSDALQLESIAAGAGEAFPADFSLESGAPGVSSVISVFSWSSGLVAASLLGSLVLVAIALRDARRLRRLLDRADCSDKRLPGIVAVCAARMGLKTAPVIRVVSSQIAPLLWVRRSGPVIVLPRQLAESLSDEELTCILSHEIAHYVRRDHWTNLISFLAAAFFWWHPVAWWARKELRAAQELCCDALVLSHSTSDRRCYARTLLRVLEFLQGEPLLPELASGFGGKSSVERRFEMIAYQKLTHRLRWWAYPIAVVLLAVLPLLPVTALDNSTPARGPWETAEAFVEAALAGRIEEAAALADPTSAGTAWAKEIWQAQGPDDHPVIVSLQTSGRGHEARATSRTLLLYVDQPGPRHWIEGKLHLALAKKSGQWRVIDASFHSAREARLSRAQSDSQLNASRKSRLQAQIAAESAASEADGRKDSDSVQSAPQSARLSSGKAQPGVAAATPPTGLAGGRDESCAKCHQQQDPTNRASGVRLQLAPMSAANCPYVQHNRHVYDENGRRINPPTLGTRQGATDAISPQPRARQGGGNEPLYQERWELDHQRRSALGSTKNYAELPPRARAGNIEPSDDDEQAPDRSPAASPKKKSDSRAESAEPEYSFFRKQYSYFKDNYSIFKEPYSYFKTKHSIFKDGPDQRSPATTTDQGADKSGRSGGKLSIRQFALDMPRADDRTGGAAETRSDKIEHLKEKVYDEVPVGSNQKRVNDWMEANTKDRATFVGSDLDRLLGKTVVEQAGLASKDISTVVRATVAAGDGSDDRLRIYFFLNSEGAVVAHYFVHWRDIARLEQMQAERGAVQP